jgi:putative transposase
MNDRGHNLPLVRQARVLGISRGSDYYLPRVVATADLALMRRIDDLHLEYPFAGSRMLQGFSMPRHMTGRLNVAALMKRMGIEAVYRFGVARTLAYNPGQVQYIGLHLMI